MKVALLTVATGRYRAFLDALYRSAREHFMRGHDVTAVLFTDGPPPDEVPFPLVRVATRHAPWPTPTLMRYHMFLGARTLLEAFDLLFYVDADSRFVGPVGEEIFGNLVATVHFGFYNRSRQAFTYERRSASRAFIPYHRGRKYYCGAVQGGRPSAYLAAAEVIAQGVDADAAHGITATWHDESHWNRYLLDHPPDVELSPSYCYPDTWNLPFERRLLALTKNSELLRAPSPGDPQPDHLAAFHAEAAKATASTPLWAPPEGRRRVRLFIGALSATSYGDRRDRCRRTWFADAVAAEGVDAVFLIGGARTVERIGDELHLPCPDDYASLPQKTAWFLEYALGAFEFDYIFKCDDDTYVSLPRLLASLTPVDYSGFDIGSCPGCIPGSYASGGAGYLLSRNAVNQIVSLLRYRTGPEDVLLGRAAREAGLSFTPNGRFRPWCAPNDVPRIDNDIITAHPVRDDLMVQVHEALREAPLSIPGHEIFETKRWTTHYGIVGLGGARGFSVDGSDRIDTGRVDFDLAPYTTISAHASSQVTIVTRVPVALRGFTDPAASNMPHSAIRFEVDGHPLGVLHSGGRKTAEVALVTMGLHTLTATCSGDPTRRYSVWALRPYRPEGLRIVMPTSNRNVDVARASLALLDRYWPDHPPVDVIRNERGVDVDGSVRQYYAGPRAEVAWAEAMIWYLEHHAQHELFLLMLDDYALCAEVNQAGLRAALALMREDPSVASYLLTWMGAPEKRPFPDRPNTILYPRWGYTVNLQAAIWRRSSFLRILKACGLKASPEVVELAGSKYFNEREFDSEKAAGARVPEPANPSLFLDSVAKDGWVLPYHNLVHQGLLDPRHASFLKRESISVELWPD